MCVYCVLWYTPIKRQNRCCFFSLLHKFFHYLDILVMFEKLLNMVIVKFVPITLINPETLQNNEVEYVWVKRVFIQVNFMILYCFKVFSDLKRDIPVDLRVFNTKNLKTAVLCPKNTRCKVSHSS